MLKWKTYGKQIAQEAIKKYGFDIPKIISEFPGARPCIVTQRLLSLNPELKRGKITVEEELKILEKIINNNKTWIQLALEMNRTLEMVRLHWVKMQGGQNYGDSQHIYKEYERLKAFRGKIDFIDRSNTPWTDDMTTRLRGLVKRLGKHFGVMESDFKPFSAAQIRYHYYSNLSSIFLPEHDIKLKELKAKGLQTREIHENHFPNHSPYAIANRLIFLEKHNSILSPDEVEKISEGLRIHGRSYLAKHAINGWNSKILTGQWMYYEPIAQKNAIWNQKKDIEIIRKPPKARKLYEQRRFEFLRHTKIPELRKRFEDAQSLQTCEKPSKGWTKEQDIKLKQLIAKHGLDFAKFSNVLPFTPKQIRQRYSSFFTSIFLPEDDLMLKKLLKTGKTSPTKLHQEHLPNHSIPAISMRAQYLRKYETILTQSQIKLISEAVEKHGSLAFYKIIEIKGWTSRRLAKQWAYFEPVDQINAIWTREVDIALVRKGLYNCGPLHKCRYHFLSKSNDPEHQDRFKASKLVNC